MIFWQAIFPEIILKSKTPLTVVYVDRSNLLTEAKVRLELYNEMFPNEMFQRPEINLRKIGKKEIVSLPFEELEKLLNNKQSFVPFEMFIQKANIEC